MNAPPQAPCHSPATAIYLDPTIVISSCCRPVSVTLDASHSLPRYLHAGSARCETPLLARDLQSLKVGCLKRSIDVRHRSGSTLVQLQRTAPRGGVYLKSALHGCTVAGTPPRALIRSANHLHRARGRVGRVWIRAPLHQGPPHNFISADSASRWSCSIARVRVGV